MHHAPCTPLLRRGIGDSSRRVLAAGSQTKSNVKGQFGDDVEEETFETRVELFPVVGALDRSSREPAEDLRYPSTGRSQVSWKQKVNQALRCNLGSSDIELALSNCLGKKCDVHLHCIRISKGSLSEIFHHLRPSKCQTSFYRTRSCQGCFWNTLWLLVAPCA